MTIPEDIQQLFDLRQKSRSDRDFEKSDALRLQLESKGYNIIDSPQGSTIEQVATEHKRPHSEPGKIALFGSGETSPSGRAVHEELIRGCTAPVRIALLETPAGFEQNPHLWYTRLRDSLIVGLANYHPVIELVAALRKDGTNSTNDPKTLAPLVDVDYIHTGAGSPTYAVTHLKNSLALKMLRQVLMRGTSLSLASASVIAFSAHAIPVYEIYKAGHDLYWEPGIGFFREWGINPVFVPHWNNTEGGEHIDTSRCYMGRARFDALVGLLSSDTVYIGIDEQTALIIDLAAREMKVSGVGTVTVNRQGTTRVLHKDETISFVEISS